MKNIYNLGEIFDGKVPGIKRKSSFAGNEAMLMSKIMPRSDVPLWGNLRKAKNISLFGDYDRDGVNNMLDCNPFNKNEQAWWHKKVKTPVGKSNVNGEVREIDELLKPSPPLETYDVEPEEKNEEANEMETYDTEDVAEEVASVKAEPLPVAVAPSTPKASFGEKLAGVWKKITTPKSYEEQLKNESQKLKLEKRKQAILQAKLVTKAEKVKVANLKQKVGTGFGGMGGMGGGFGLPSNVKMAEISGMNRTFNPADTIESNIGLGGSPKSSSRGGNLRMPGSNIDQFFMKRGGNFDVSAYTGKQGKPSGGMDKFLMKRNANVGVDKFLMKRKANVGMDKYLMKGTGGFNMDKLLMRKGSGGFNMDKLLMRKGSGGFNIDKLLIGKKKK